MVTAKQIADVRESETKLSSPRELAVEVQASDHLNKILDLFHQSTFAEGHKNFVCECENQANLPGWEAV